MGTKGSRYSKEFREDAVRQVVEYSRPVRDVAHAGGVQLRANVLVGCWPSLMFMMNPSLIKMLKSSLLTTLVGVQLIVMSSWML